MENFTKNRNIEQGKTPAGPLFPNNMEAVLKPLGKVMKIDHFQNQRANVTSSLFLVNYRDTPHAVKGVSPAQIIFRDGYQGNLHTSHYLIRK